MNSNNGSILNKKHLSKNFFLKKRQITSNNKIYDKNNENEQSKLYQK